MAGETFFVRSRGKITGPYDMAGLQRLVKLGMLSRVHEVSTDKRNWSSAATVPGVLPAAAPPPVATVRADSGPAASPSNAYDIAEPPASGGPSLAAARPAPQPAAAGSPVGTCAMCGSMMEAAMLINDHGRLTCPTCYQRMVQSRPPTTSSPVGEAGYYGSGVASLVLGIAGIIIPTAGPLCLYLATNVSRDMTIVFWGILLVGLACAIAATVFASATIRGNKRAKSRDGNGLATTGLVLGIVSLSGYAMWFVYLAIIFAAMALKAAHHVH